MSHLQYLIILGACLVFTLPLELLLGARVYGQPRRLLYTVVPVAAIFSIFDGLSVKWHWWHYAATYTTGIKIFGVLPIEEVAFFVVIPICGLLTYGAVATTKSRIVQARARWTTRHRDTLDKPKGR